MIKAKLISKEEVAKDVYLITFPKTFDFKAGQVVGLTTTEEIASRLYSLCSSPTNKNAQVIFNVRKQGELTPALANLKASDYVYLDEPHGTFLGTKDPAWLIATGTGVAPYYSMLQSGFAENKTLIHGEQSAGRFYFSEEIKKQLGKNYVRCSSRDKSGDFHGRVDAYLNSIKTLPTNVKYYLCGNPDMVIDVRDNLISRGISYQNIVSEIYF